ncbi:hypothetical protein QN277_017025 [Acacia crassicarpa]|uniref:Legume lectin domain-containing protein n=1 Tax=Acacia crassicarpa TaxID=499986 RepID=A0AAE1JNC0_9FABA|nr:hypothetical protein QN277_017025 [Acacia crassicarpa]
MAFNFNYISIFCVFVFNAIALIPRPCSSSPTQHSLHLNPNFDPEIDLFGDAKVVDGGAHVKLTRPLPSSSGLILRRNPIKFIHPVSFFTEFSFSISPNDGDGLLLALVPGNFSLEFPGKSSFGISSENNYLGVEFDTSKDRNEGDLNANHIGLNVGSPMSVAVGNVSAINLVLNSGVKLQAWIDYSASSKRLEVRLSRLGDDRPANPITACEIDLLRMWGGRDVVAGITSSNRGASAQIINVYSWKLSWRGVPKSLHSVPADPGDERVREETAMGGQERNYSAFTLLARLIFTTGCVALISFVGLFMWAIFENWLADSAVAAADARYERIHVTVDKNTDHHGKLATSCP